ncbi:hypothetical protein [Sphingomonas sp.]|uniref:hypothetical protein n=1 Tax=Sphingomonas sp. TaxID=28214 RepID=UPI0025E7A85D|nr:hypothetical protein [Sphingomonas sp.]
MDQRADVFDSPASVIGVLVPSIEQGGNERVRDRRSGIEQANRRCLRVAGFQPVHQFIRPEPLLCPVQAHEEARRVARHAQFRDRIRVRDDAAKILSRRVDDDDIAFRKFQGVFPNRERKQLRNRLEAGPRSLSEPDLPPGLRVRRRKQLGSVGIKGSRHCQAGCLDRCDEPLVSRRPAFDDRSVFQRLLFDVVLGRVSLDLAEIVAPL